MWAPGRRAAAQHAMRSPTRSSTRGGPVDAAREVGMLTRMPDRPTAHPNGDTASERGARPPKPKQPSRAEREARLAEALRANLKKRKAQAQTRSQDSPGEST